MRNRPHIGPARLPGTLLALLLLVGPAMGQQVNPANLLFDDPVLARGQGFEIKTSQLEATYLIFKATLAARGQPFPESQRTLREAQMLDHLIVSQLLGSRATETDKARAAERVDRMIEESRKSNAEEAFLRQLKAFGFTRDQHEKRILEQAISEAVLDREIRSGITIPDAQVEEYYQTGTDAVVKILREELNRLANDPDTTLDQLTGLQQRIEDIQKANLAPLLIPEKVRVSHILLATRDLATEEELPANQQKAKLDQAEKLLARARAGEDFAKLVAEYSEDRNVKQTQGEYTVTRNSNFVPEFKAAAFALAGQNQISDIVVTIFGYHIIKLHERIPGQKIELEKVAGEIRNGLRDQEMKRLLPDYFARLKKEAGVEILEPKYRFESPPRIPTPGASPQSPAAEK